MTTLPTTSTYRLPRSPGGPPTLPPGGQSPLGGGVASLAPSLTPADVWRIIRGNVWLILATIVVAIAVGIGIYSYLRATDPKYRSVGTLLVDRPYRVNPTNQASNELTQFDFNLEVEQRTQQQQLLAETLWIDVLQENEKVRETKWFKDIQAKSEASGAGSAQLALADLDRNLRATPVTSTKLIQMTMDCASGTDASDILRAIGDAHIKNQRERFEKRTSDEYKYAVEWQSRYVTLARQTKDKMNAQLARASVDVGRQTIREMELSNLVNAQTKARLEAAEAAGMLKSINEQIDGGKDPYQVEMIVRNDPAVQRLQARLEELELSIGSQTVTGSDSTTIKNLTAAKNAARERLEKAESNARAMARAQVLDSTKSDATAKKNEADTIDERVERLKTELTEMVAARGEYTTLKDEFDNYKLLEREMAERVAVLKNANQQETSSVTWSSFPTKPTDLSSPNLKVILPVAIMAGLALSLGIAFLRELADTSVRSPRDIARVGPMNVLGMVARESDDPELTGVPLHTVIATAPQSLLAEQLRQVRTRLQHAVSLDTTRSILVTSPGPGDGKTTIAANLAAGLALNGRRILLVDANFHRPSLHKLYNVSNDTGFSNALESVGNLEGAVKKTATANLEVLTTGPRPANQTELLESPLFTDFIERALEEYDHVIFDGGPLLVVSEAVALAPRVDGVVVVVRAKQNTRGMLSRVKETLKQIKAEQLGVVLNGVQTWGGGYYARNIKTYYDYQK